MTFIKEKSDFSDLSFYKYMLTCIITMSIDNPKIKPARKLTEDTAVVAIDIPLVILFLIPLTPIGIPIAETIAQVQTNKVIIVRMAFAFGLSE